MCPAFGDRAQIQPCDACRVDSAEEVLEAAQARASALVAADAGQLAGLLHEDFRWTSHLGERYDRDAYIDRNTRGATVWGSQEMSGVEIVVVGDTAVLYADVTDV